MRRVGVLLVLGVLLTMAQGAAAAYLPLGWCPDLGLLLVVAMGLTWRSTAGGVLVAALVGYSADLLSGTLLGQHALLRVLIYGVARAFSAQIDLRAALPQAVWVAMLTVAAAALLSATTAFFVPDAGFAMAPPRALAAHALANALCTPLVTGLTGRLVALLGSEEESRRLLHFEPRSFGA